MKANKYSLHAIILQALLWILLMALPLRLSIGIMMVLAIYSCGTIARSIVWFFERRMLMQIQAQAYKEGYQAYTEGKQMEDNPYLAGPNPNLMGVGGWFAGWNYARMESNNKEVS